MLHRLGAEAYGLWIVALALPGMASGLDNALYLAIVREAGVHHAGTRIVDKDAVEFLTACCGGYLTFGMLGGILLVLGERSILHGIPLSPAVRDAASVTFVAVAISFAAGRMVVFGNAVLAGMQRFGRINAISVAALLLRFAGFAALLLQNDSLRASAGWYAFVSVVEALLIVTLVKRAGALGGIPALLRWRVLRRSGEFAISSFLTSLLQNLCWFSPPVLLGILSGGTTSSLSLYAGQRPCYMISDLTWRGAEVVFAAAAGEQGSRADEGETRALMLTGTRYLLAIALPLCVGLLLLAPVLVRVWLREAHPETATVMRFTALGVIADALWAGPLHVLWARGYARRVLWITAGITASILALNLLLIPRFGPAGSALAFAISTWLGALVTCILAARETRMATREFLLQSFADTWLPATLLALLVFLLMRAMPLQPRSLLALCALAGGALYTVAYWKFLRLRDGSREPLRLWFGRLFNAL